MNCILIDDDALSRLSLKKCIERVSSLELIGEYSSAQEGLDGVNEKRPDLIFLDIEMPGMSGLEFIETVQTEAQIIIVSSKSEYAIDAFNFDVTDYLTKPIDFERFMKAVERVDTVNKNVEVDQQEVDNLFIKADSKYVKIDLNEIQYIEALSDYVSIYTDKGRFVLLGTMKGMESKLSVSKFVRIHRSYIVNLSRIVSIQDGYVKVGENQLPISRGSKENLMQKIKILN